MQLILLSILPYTTNILEYHGIWKKHTQSKTYPIARGWMMTIMFAEKGDLLSQELKENTI